MPIRRFLDPDEAELESWVSGLEGGARTEYQDRRRRETTGSGGVDLGFVDGSGEHVRESEQTTQMSDTPSARFGRLEDALKATDDLHELIEPTNADLSELRPGTVVEFVECEVSIPQASRLLASAGGAGETLRAIRALQPFAEAFGLPIGGLPPSTEIDAAEGMLEQFASDGQTLLASLEGTKYKVTGTLRDENTRAEIDGLANVVGQVSNIIKDGEWHPLIKLPGQKLMSREQRRKAPDVKLRDAFVRGPVIVLDVLAIYR